jgi:hypothetical protein
MITELGHFSLILTLFVALIQSTIPLIGFSLIDAVPDARPGHVRLRRHQPGPADTTPISLEETRRSDGSMQEYDA